MIINKRINLVLGTIAVALVMLAPFNLRANELFSDSIDREFRSTGTLTTETTMGGYPLYIGGRQWSVLRGSAKNNNLNLPIGYLSVLSNQNGKFFLQIDYAVSLAQSNSYFLAEPCKGSHLAKNNEGGGYNDNCMTIDPHEDTINGSKLLAFKIQISNSQKGGRLYGMTIYLNMNQLGLGNTNFYEWTEEHLTKNPAKAKAIKDISEWAISLQHGVAKAIGYKKPMDAFDGVPPLDELVLKVSGGQIPSSNSDVLVPVKQDSVIQKDPAPSSQPNNRNTLSQRLTELKELLKDNLITKEQYEQRSTEIIREF